ncbi:MAG: hypothetical protein GY927_17920 [bacterium]|nr:hypothetical protein [bacterium]
MNRGPRVGEVCFRKSCEYPFCHVFAVILLTQNTCPNLCSRQGGCIQILQGSSAFFLTTFFRGSSNVSDQQVKDIQGIIARNHFKCRHEGHSRRNFFLIRHPSDFVHGDHARVASQGF